MLANGLVDEPHPMVGAAPLGAGTPIFRENSPALHLIDTRTFDGSDNVLHRYRVERPAS
ncbi:hypothetical protein ACFQZZ_10025 [Nocardia sp. GCM10030253]|uniref:hypothetical protein n=1 Tax=Nocardia sp. GCM10030253 TaxID=3273404 RepID=UPI00362D3BA3